MSSRPATLPAWKCVSPRHHSDMASLDGAGWDLLNGVERHAESPSTFEIPEEAIRTQLVPGCDAKLMFALRGRDEVRVERMWVQIVGYTDTGYAGVLNNEPRIAGTTLSLGDRVEFEPDHVINTLPRANWDPETKEYVQ